MHASEGDSVTEPALRPARDDRRPLPLRKRRLSRQTRRALLERLTQVGLLAAALELIAACDRLPGQAPRVPRIGWVANLAPADDAGPKAFTEGLVAGLGNYGYIPGQNLQMESRFPTVASQNPEMVSDLLGWGADVLVTGGTAATQAAKQATSTVPIVGIYVGDPRWARDWCRASRDQAAT